MKTQRFFPCSWCSHHIYFKQILSLFGTVCFHNTLVVPEKPTIRILAQMESGRQAGLAKPVGEFLQYRLNIMPKTMKTAVPNSLEVEKQSASQSPQQFSEVVADGTHQSVDFIPFISL